jgi:hypothetical protein
MTEWSAKLPLFAVTALLVLHRIPVVDATQLGLPRGLGSTPGRIGRVGNGQRVGSGMSVERNCCERDVISNRGLIADNPKKKH